MAEGDRYGRILRRVWVDETFLQWSAPAPSAQFLWFYLLTTPRSGSIPGVYTLSIHETAKRLRWPADATAEVFAEITREGRAVHDESTELLYLPNAINHDPPRNLNVLKSWRRQWAELPNCDLKRRIESDFATYFASSTAGFSEEWRALNTKQNQAGKPLPEFRPTNSDLNSRNSSVDSGSPTQNRIAESPSVTATATVPVLSEGVQGEPSRADLAAAEIANAADLFPEADARDLDAWARRLLKDPDLHLPPAVHLAPYLRAALRKLGSKVAENPAMKTGQRLAFIQGVARGLVNDDKANGWASGKTEGREGVCAPAKGRERAPAGPSTGGDDYVAFELAEMKKLEAEQAKRRAEDAEREKNRMSPEEGKRRIAEAMAKFGSGGRAA